MIKWAERLAFVRRKRFLYFAVLVVLAIVIIAVWFFVVRDDDNISKQVNSGGATPEQVEKGLDRTKDELLKEENYDAFQTSQQSLAIQYLNNNDPKNAERVMKNVIAKVPKDKLRVDVYMELWDISKKKGDTASAKQYAQKVVDMLKAQDSQKEVEQWSKEL